jgi:hypothetical protein
MLQKLSIFNAILLVIGAIFLGVNVEGSTSTSDATNETDSLTDNKTMSSNKTSNDTSAASGNNTIILNAAEVGDEEQYRWVDASGQKILLSTLWPIKTILLKFPILLMRNIN